LEYGRTLSTGGLCAGILLSAIGFAVAVSADSPNVSLPQRIAPDFSLPAISDRNETITLSAYRGKTVYLDFWSSWCAPCRESLPLLNELHDELAGDDFAIVAVNLDAHPADGRRLMTQFAIKYPVASDIIGVAADKFGLSTLPASYLISHEGVIQAELPQIDKQNIAAIRTSLLELIDQSGESHAPLVN
jgi:thiol-disulfide isomerase/thioredoxin